MGIVGIDPTARDDTDRLKESRTRHKWDKKERSDRRELDLIDS